MLEFALPTGGAHAESQPAAAMSRDEKPVKSSRKSKIRVRAPSGEDRKVAASGLASGFNGGTSASDAKLERDEAPTSTTATVTKGSCPEGADETVSAVATVAREYQVKAFELMTSNVSATLEYAQRLVGVRTPGGFVELSMGHVRRQSELIVRQTTELVSIAQRLARLRRKTA